MCASALTSADRTKPRTAALVLGSRRWYVRALAESGGGAGSPGKAIETRWAKLETRKRAGTADVFGVQGRPQMLA